MCANTRQFFCVQESMLHCNIAFIARVKKDGCNGDTESMLKVRSITMCVIKLIDKVTIKVCQSTDGFV